MSAAFINPYGAEWGIGYLWHRLDWLVRIDVAALGLLLAYVVYVVIRVFRCYHTVRRGGEINTRTKKLAAADLNIQVGNLKSIATTAPYFGLMGTCLGLLSAFSGVGMQRDAARAWIATKIAAALVPAASGILVAVPATCGYEYARTRLDLLLNELPRRKLVLASRFTLPPFALIAAYGLAILVQTYMTLPAAHTPKGFDIQIAPARCDPDLSDRLIVLHISKDGKIFLNLEEEQNWSNLQTRLSDVYSMRTSRTIYLLADEEVPFQTVADAIDNVKSAPEADTSNPLNITLRLITPTAMKAPCPKPVVSDFTFRHSK